MNGVTMDGDPDQLNQGEKAEKIDTLLKNRQAHRDEKAQKLVEQSHEQARVNRMNSADVDALTKSQKAEKLEKFLKRKRQGNRRRQKHVSVKTVRAEAAKILEEFLRSQLEDSSVIAKPREGRYERYVEVDITEETSPSSEGSGLNRQESIPFADEDDSDVILKKAESLPADHKEKYLGDSSDKLKVPIHHEKSRSAPHASTIENEENIPQYVPKRAKTVPPPPPPGTPHSISEEGSEERVPYIGIPQADLAQLTDQSSSLPHSTDAHSIDTLDDYRYSSYKSSDHDSSSQQTRVKHPTPERQPPDSLDIIPHLIGQKPLSPLSEHDRTKSHSPSPSPQKSSQSLYRKIFKKSGSVSSSDTDAGSSGSFQGRKKKSMFKKAQERFRSFLRIQSDQDSPTEIPRENFDQRPKHVKKPKKKQKHHDKHAKDHVDDEMDVYEPPSGKVLEERFTHTNKHIGQHHTQWGGGFVRTEDATETVEISNGSGKKHIEKHWKIKESSDSGKGIMGRLRRMTSREKGSKKQIKGSKSTTFEHGDKKKQYSRTISAPGHHGDRSHPIHEGDAKQRVRLESGGFTVTDIDRGVEGNKEHITATQVVSRPEDIRRNSSSLDIVDHTGAMVERIWFDPNDDLPRNKSFDFDLESCVHETRVNKKGKIHTIQDVDMHQHMDTAEDREMDGITEGPEQEIDEMTQAERERLYGVIAERLAAIGDSYTIDKQDQAAKEGSTSPRGRITVTAGATPDEISREHLNALEIELSDTLREVAENIDERLAENARQAAVRIAGIVTYNQFKSTVGEAVGKEIGWDQVSALFNITKRAIQVAGASGALAAQIKEMSLRYFEDKFASWIVGQGGWDSVLSDSSTDSELD